MSNPKFQMYPNAQTANGRYKYIVCEQEQEHGHGHGCMTNGNYILFILYDKLASRRAMVFHIVRMERPNDIYNVYIMFTEWWLFSQSQSNAEVERKRKRTWDTTREWTSQWHYIFGVSAYSASETSAFYCTNQLESKVFVRFMTSDSNFGDWRHFVVESIKQQSAEHKSHRRWTVNNE